MTGILHDLRYALRGWRQRPGVALVAVLSLGVGIGVNAAIFSLVDAVYLHPFDVAAPAQLVSITSYDRNGTRDQDSYADYRDLAPQCPAFSQLFAESRRGALLVLNGETETVMLTVVSDNYFSALGVHAQQGRLFSPALDAALSREPAVVISHNLWRRRFSGRADLVGRTINLHNSHYTVVGIAPRNFRGLAIGLSNDIWAPTSTWAALSHGNREEMESHGNRAFSLYARLAPGARLAQAQSQWNTAVVRLAAAYPDTNAGRRGSLRPLVGGSGEMTVLALLLGSVGALVLLIACVNVATLLLAQGEMRAGEIGVRLALGAGRARLVRQMLTEGLVFALSGATIGLLLAEAFLESLPALMPPGPVRIDLGAHLNARLLVFTLLAAVATVLVFGLAPALRAARTGLMPALKSRGIEAGTRRFPLHSVLASGQIGLSVVLLVVAGLLWHSLLNTSRIPPGFDTAKRLLTIQLAPGRNLREPGQAALYYEDLAARARAVPGVRRASYTRRVPLSGSGGGATVEVTIPGQEPPRGANGYAIAYNQVAPDYFATMGTHLLRGRCFNTGDTPESTRVVIINDAMARRFWPGHDPVGRTITSAGKPAEIVGVVEEGRWRSLTEPATPVVYFPAAQRRMGEFTLVAETSGEPVALAAQVKRALRTADPGVVILEVNTLQDLLSASLWADRAVATVAGSVAGLGMALSAVGLYSVLAFFVNRRRREIGIRLAVGAGRADILRSVLLRGLKLAAWALPPGVAAAYAVSRLLSSQLYGVGAADPGSFAATLLIVLVVVVAASAVPAWLAARVDPVLTLRYE
jgi:predicted permease